MKKVLNVGMIGGGFMGKAHSMAMAAMPILFETDAVPYRKMLADVDEKTAKASAEKLGFESYTTDWKAMVENPEIDIIDIVTPNNFHEEMAIAAAKAGKHVISEKPLGRNSQETKRMLDAVEEAKVKNSVAFNYRKTPAVALAKKFIGEGAIGKILNFRGTYLQDWSADPESPLSWRFKEAVAGSGALGDIGTHVIDFAHYLVGDISEVMSTAQTWIKERPIQEGGVDTLGVSRVETTNKGPVDVDDEISTLLKFENGAVGSIEATRNAWGRNNFLTFEIHGEEGSIYFNYERRDELQVCFAKDADDRRGYRTIYTGAAHPYGKGLWPIPGMGIGYSEVKINEMYDFMQAISEDKECEPNFLEGHKVAVVTDAILNSAAKQQWVKVDM